MSRFVGLLYCPYRIPDENDKYVETFEDCDVFFGHFSNKFNLEKNQAWNYIQQKHLLKNKNQDQKQCAGCSGGCVTDAQAGFQISEAFTPFSQKDEIFSRSFWDETIHSEKTDRFYTDILIWAGLTNCAQLPAINIPLGFSKSGLPISMQAIGPYLEDKTTLEFAKLIKEITGGFVAPPD